MSINPTAIDVGGFNMKQKSPNKECGFIPQRIYEQMVKYMPIVSIEALIVSGGKLLFLKRSNKPAKGQWWFPGGRIRKTESLEEALYREIKEETGLEIISAKFVGVYSRVFPERHDITVAYLCRSKESVVHLNDEHSEYRFFSRNPIRLNHFLVETVSDSKWKKFI